MANKITKTDVIAKVADQTGLSKTQVEKVLSELIDLVTTSVKKDVDVVLTGFGTFKKTKRAAREGRNPQTGAAIKIKASSSVGFKVGKALKDAVN